MRKTILLSTALILGLTVNNLHIIADDTTPANDKKDDIAQPNPFDNQLQQPEIKLNTTQNNDTREQERTTGQSSIAETTKQTIQDNTSNINIQQKAQNMLNTQTKTSTTPTMPITSYKPTRGQTKTAHLSHITAYRQTRIKSAKTRNANIKLTNYNFTFCQRTMPKLTQTSNLHHVALMTMDNLLHASTNNPLAGRRHYVTKHINKIPTFY